MLSLDWKFSADGWKNFISRHKIKQTKSVVKILHDSAPQPSKFEYSLVFFQTTSALATTTEMVVLPQRALAIKQAEIWNRLMQAAIAT